jgi:isopentenyl-diphosphate delta-isomerase
VRMSRKMEHVRHALDLVATGRNGLADIQLVHNCLPDASTDAVAFTTRIGDLTLSSPIFINAMTGGAHETEAINRELAVVAREKGLAMAVGSQMSAIRNKEVAYSYRIVRKMNPDGVIFANLGSEATVEQALEAVDMVQANALQIHLNVMQELIMPEGDRDFRHALERIAAIAERLPVPVIVKEVGFGIMAEGAAKLKAIGVPIVDVGGSGGTNFAAIENARRANSLDWLNDWGHPTSVALLETLSVYGPGSVIASGGIASSADVIRALCLGASAVGIAGAFLRVLQTEGTEAAMRLADELHEGLRLMMTALGASTVPELWRKPVVVGGDTAAWCAARGIDTTAYARRGNATKK